MQTRASIACQSSDLCLLCCGARYEENPCCAQNAVDETLSGIGSASIAAFALQPRLLEICFVQDGYVMCTLSCEHAVSDSIM